jgi:hypothetical protein
MALSDKNIVITPNIGAAADPKIVFSGADANTTAQNITLTTYPTANGTLSFDGSAGQLFSITNSLSGTIFSVNDVSGIPSIEVLDTGTIKLGQYSGNILLGTVTDNGNKLQVNGSVSVTGQITSTIATGTAPLQVASNTVVANLNSQLLNGLPSSSFASLSGSETLVNKTFQAYTEKVSTIGTISTATYSLDTSLANIFDLTLNANVTLTFTNVPAAGNSRPVTLIVRQPASSAGKLLTVTGAKYTDGVLPILSTNVNAIDVLAFWSIDGGTTHIGTFAMANVS